MVVGGPIVPGGPDCPGCASGGAPTFNVPTGYPPAGYPPVGYPPQIGKPMPLPGATIVPGNELPNPMPVNPKAGN
ncbi:MAG: hypothetical protein C0467_25775 [Planctomycetaceae bacterium]|nr:hypothetical protein [Planctomycetaceae bacterium]